MDTVLCSALELSAKFAIQYVENRFFRCQCIGQGTTFAYRCSFTLHTSYIGRLDQLEESCQNAQNKLLKKLILYKPVALHLFIMACIQCVVMIHLSEQVRQIEL